MRWITLSASGGIRNGVLGWLWKLRRINFNVREPTVEVRRRPAPLGKRAKPGTLLTLRSSDGMNDSKRSDTASSSRKRERPNSSRRRLRSLKRGPPADWTSEEKQQFETNRVICASEPQEQLAGEYNVHDDVGSIAHAVGREFRLRQDMEIAAEEGCLEALVGR